MNNASLKEFLDLKYEQYNTPEFIISDPVSIPHKFSKKEDIEISAFLTATIAWGQRTTIINNAMRLAEWMDFNPYNFLMNASANEINVFKKFTHRTFNGNDCIFFIRALQNIYKKYASVEMVFYKGYSSDKTVKSGIVGLRRVFFELPHETRNEKHFPSPEKNSSCKRINLFLRWMIRNDNKGVDFGIWKNIPSSALMCPLDVHSGNISRKIGLLTRKQNDWKAVEELTDKLRMLDASDPVKYDFALFGTGVFENIL